jgi:3-oxoacyl-[acyl-carrier-protein] synthase III
MKSKIESLGTYLPDDILTNKEALPENNHKLSFLFSKITGIQERRIAKNNEFAIDLGTNASLNALEKSSYLAKDIDLIISCSITKNVDHAYHFQYEPSLSSIIKKRIKAVNANTFDVTNACAGMFTGIYIMDSLIRSGKVKCGIVVSGERITDLTKFARNEINSIFDDQFPSLTLGDSGAAVIMDTSLDSKYGIQNLELTSIADFNKLCMAHPKKNGVGAKMITDGKKLHQAGLITEKILIKEFMDKSSWKYDDINIFIPHQTTLRAIKEGAKVLNHLFQSDKDKQGLSVVQKYGNTASTSHFITLDHALKNELIKKDDPILFLIQASGIVIGHCLYLMDDLALQYH